MMIVYDPALSESHAGKGEGADEAVRRERTAFSSRLAKAKGSRACLLLSANQLFDNTAVVRLMDRDADLLAENFERGHVRAMELPSGTYADYVRRMGEPGFSSNVEALLGPEEAARLRQKALEFAERLDAAPGWTTAPLAHDKARETLSWPDAMDALAEAATSAGSESKAAVEAVAASTRNRSEAYALLASCSFDGMDVRSLVDDAYSGICLHNSGLEGFAFDAKRIVAAFDKRLDAERMPREDIEAPAPLGFSAEMELA